MCITMLYFMLLVGLCQMTSGMVFFKTDVYQQREAQRQASNHVRSAVSSLYENSGSGYETASNSYCQSASLDYPPGTIVTITCPTGYELVGADASTCNTRGFWTTGGVGFCRRRAAVKQCEIPRTPENAFIADHKSHGDRYQAGDYILFECLDGFQFQEDESGRIVCHPSGFWSEELPVCRRMSVIVQKKTEQQQPPAPSQTSKGPQTPGGATTPSATASSSPATPPTPAVASTNKHLRQMAKRCPGPERLRNAHVVGQRLIGGQPPKDYEADDFIRYVCNEGFEMLTGNGEAVITCQPDGTWSGEIPNCERTPSKRPAEIGSGSISSASTTSTCIGPEIPENAYIVEQSRPLLANRFSLGSYITYDCVFDFTMSGEKTVFCGLGGKWSTVPPKCNRLTPQQQQQQQANRAGSKNQHRSNNNNNNNAVLMKHHSRPLTYEP